MLAYVDTLNNIRTSVTDHKIWVSIDETTDATGRYVANVVIGILSPERPGQKFLLTSEVLKEVNHSSIDKLFDNAMFLLWPDGIKTENILLFVTDTAPYMTKAASKIQEGYHRMIHLTCLAHGLHRVAEQIRKHFSDVDDFISNMKKVFLKAPSRVLKFKEIAPGIPLPPQPILTRWGSWLMAAVYYFEHYNQIVQVINTFDTEASSAIKVTKSLISPQLYEHLQLINNIFKDVPLTIKKLESSHMAISESFKLVDNLTRHFIEVNKFSAAEITKQKMKSVLDKNPEYATICRIRDYFLNNENTKCFSQTDMCNVHYFRFAPVTSCDVERSFSRYKVCLSDNRRRFSFDTLRKYIVIHCNSCTSM